MSNEKVNGQNLSNGMLYMGPNGSNINGFVDEMTKPRELPTLLFQTDERLNSQINKYGCRFMSLLAIPQMYMNKVLEASTIMDIYNSVIKDPKVMNSNCLCGEREDIITLEGFRALGVNDKKAAQFNPWTAKTEADIPESTDFTIIQWRTFVSGEYASHFELGDKYGNDLYDPGNTSFDKFIRRVYNIDENDTRVDINTREFKPERYLLYKIFNI